LTTASDTSHLKEISSSLAFLRLALNSALVPVFGNASKISSKSLFQSRLVTFKTSISLTLSIVLLLVSTFVSGASVKELKIPSVLVGVVGLLSTF
jgi:hypothetical protein